MCHHTSTGLYDIVIAIHIKQLQRNEIVVGILCLATRPGTELEEDNWRHERFLRHLFFSASLPHISGIVYFFSNVCR